jgi:hypothetical protein
LLSYGALAQEPLKISVACYGCLLEALMMMWKSRTQDLRRESGCTMSEVMGA